ncbi:MAG: hypothetical protein ABIS23_06535 [Sphingomicrobium sp.]
MTYGLNRHDFIENGPTAMAIQVRSSRSTARTWHVLNANRRLALVERAINPANDIGIDEYPIAL